MKSLTIDGDAGYRFVGEDDPIDDPDALSRIIEVGQIIESMEVGGGAEAANVVVRLDNGDGALTGIFASPPLRSQAIVANNGLTFDGMITLIGVDEEVRITIEG